MSLEGTTLVGADTQENQKALERPGARRGQSALPKIRFAALLENGTHVLGAARMGPLATGELTPAREVVPALGSGMLYLGDRLLAG